MTEVTIKNDATANCVGHHFIIDVWGTDNLNSVSYVEKSMIEMAKEAKATVLKTFMHPFEANGGVTGVALLAESHISVHTWPEFGFAAFDIFMCGEADIQKAINVLKRCFPVEQYSIKKLTRGNKL